MGAKLIVLESECADERGCLIFVSLFFRLVISTGLFTSRLFGVNVCTLELLKRLKKETSYTTWSPDLHKKYCPRDQIYAFC